MQRDEAYIGLMGGFGSIKLGAANSIGLTTFLAGSPLGTGIGSGYGVTALDYSFIRHSRSARYDSPVMNGFAVAINYAPGAETAVAATAGAVPSIPAGNEVTELGLSYNNGPLSLNYANVSQAAQLTNVRTSANILAARYTIGSTVLSAGWNDGDAVGRGAATIATEGYRVGVAHTMGAVTLLGSHAVQKLTASEEKVTGLRADYALSKRTAAYVGYENYDNAGVDRKTTSIGVRHAF
jgi:predicted porin